MSTGTSCGRPVPDAIRKVAQESDAQLRLPLFREVSPRSGLLARNTVLGDRVRRFLQRHLPTGAPGWIAGEIGAHKARIYAELEGRVCMSFDFVWSSICLLTPDVRYRVFAALLRPFGYALVYMGEVRDLDGSVA